MLSSAHGRGRSTCTRSSTTSRATCCRAALRVGVPQPDRGAERPATAVERVVTETAGVACTIRDAVRATICGVRNEADPDAETVYRLSIVFDARSCTAAETWR